MILCLCLSLMIGTTWLALVLYSVLKWQVCVCVPGVPRVCRGVLHDTLCPVMLRVRRHCWDRAGDAMVLAVLTLENIIVSDEYFVVVFFTVWVFFCIYWPIVVLSSTSYCWTIGVVLHFCLLCWWFSVKEDHLVLFVPSSNSCQRNVPGWGRRRT